jgi:hypothetical protein
MNPNVIKGLDTGMELPKGSPIKSIRVLTREPGGNLTTVAVYADKRRKRRVSKRFRGLEKLVRRLAEARSVTAREYLARHEQANAKKKDGWLKRFPKNSMKALRKGRKKLKLRLR